MSATKWILLLSALAALVGLSVQGCAPAVPALAVDVTADPTSGEAPLTTLATATVSGGVAPYIYLWTSAPGGVIAKPLQSSTNVVFAIAGTYTVTCTVTDSTGQVVSASATVTASLAGDATAGETLYNSTCITCHPSPAAVAPSADQITNDMGTIDSEMDGITLTNQQIADLQAYLATQ